MKLKINWGGGIFIAIVVMVTFMIVLVFIATRQDFYLVEKDYYEKAVNYQEKIDKIKNANALTEKLIIQYGEKQLKLQFPGIFQNDTLTGSIDLYSPVNENYDKNIPIKLDSGLSQLVSLENLPKGRYKVKVDWTANQKQFYQEIEIIHQ